VYILSKLVINQGELTYYAGGRTQSKRSED
jgi:hypothetical protein